MTDDGEGAMLLWADARDRGVRLFNGQVPRPDDEVAIVEVFKRQPALVITAISAVAAKLELGEVTWGWAVLRKRVEADSTPVEAAAGAVANPKAERSAVVARAKRWLYAAGKHCPTKAEVEDELFGRRGTLHAWRGDRALVDELLAEYAKVRPLGIQIANEAIEDGLRWQASRRRAAELVTAERAQRATAAADRDQAARARPTALSGPPAADPAENPAAAAAPANPFL